MAVLDYHVLLENGLLALTGTAENKVKEIRVIRVMRAYRLLKKLGPQGYEGL